MPDQTQALFFPSVDNSQVIVKLLSESTSSIDLAIFYLSYPLFANELLKAIQRKIPVRILVESDNLYVPGSAVRKLQEAGALIKSDFVKHSRMHHKFCIIDGKVLINGSLNWTRQASKINQENAIVHYDKKLISRF
jgi:mitochondrial cardiolipin hydrolase